MLPGSAGPSFPHWQHAQNRALPASHYPSAYTGGRRHCPATHGKRVAAASAVTAAVTMSVFRIRCTGKYVLTGVGLLAARPLPPLSSSRCRLVPVVPPLDDGFELDFPTLLGKRSGLFWFLF